MSGHGAGSTASMPPIIAFREVGKVFPHKHGDVTATRDITVSIHEGEIVSIVGPSGCGKTTCSISWPA